MSRPAGLEPDTVGTLSAAAVPPVVAAIPTLHAPASASGWFEPLAELPRITGYETLKVLGRGGMGVVYLARQMALGRLVALKMVLSGVHAGQDRLARFHTEAEAAARLQHPHIVQIFETGESDGQPFLTMEYVEGGSLADRLDGKPQPWRSAATFLGTLAGAVHHAHQRGIVHRDLKPANILLQDVESKNTSEGSEKCRNEVAGGFHSSAAGNCLLTAVFSPKITDFGIAKLIGNSATQTPGGAILGTPGYMAPEQVGSSDPVGPAADIHALGAILYELLTGRRPFQAEETLAILAQIRSQEPVAPRRLAVDIPLDLETICLKCLHKEPGRRYENALALEEDLHRCLAGEPIHARRVSTWERGIKWAQRRPTHAALLVVSCLAALALAGMAAGVNYNTRLQALNADLKGAVQSAQIARAEAEKQRATVGKMERWGRYLRDIHLADEAWQNGQVRRMPALLAGCPRDLRGWEWYYLHGLARKDGRTLQHSAGVLTVAFDQSGRRLATGCQDGAVWIWDVAAGTSHPLQEHHGGAVWNVAFSPDCRLIASAGEDRCVRIWECVSGRLVRILRKHGGPLRCLAFSPDARTLAAAGKEGTIKLWETESGHELRVLSGHGCEVSSLAFAPNGRRLASGGADRALRLWDPDSGVLVQTLQGHSEEIHGVAFSPDGIVLASAGGEGTLRTWDAASGTALANYYPPQKTAFLGVAFGPEGRLAAASDARLVYLWDQAVLRTFRGHNHRIQAVAFSPDGRCLASASPDRTVKIWQVNAGQESRDFPVQSDRVLGAAFRSGGRQVIDAALDGSVRLWNAKNGKLLDRWEADLDRPRGIAYSSDGRFLAAAGRRGTIRCYDLTTKAVVSARQLGAPARAVVFSPDGLLLACGDDEGMVNIWETAGDHLLFTGTGHTGPVRALAFSSDSHTLASGSLDGVRLWDVPSGCERAAFVREMPRVVSLAFSPDGALAVAQMGGAISVWDTDTGNCRGSLVGHSAMVWCMAFTPDGARLASASRDLTVKLWDTSSGQEVLTLRGFTSEVSGVAFNADATCLVTTDLAGSVRLWDAERAGEKVIGAGQGTQRL